MPPLTPQTPDWWVARLYKQLVARQKNIEFFDAYYRGDFPLPWLAPQAHDDAKRVLKMARANMMGLVVDSTAERCNLVGFRVGDAAQGDADTQRIWQANNLDAGFDQAITESLIGGVSHLMVAPNPKQRDLPFITVEHGSQAIVEYVPGTARRERAAGLKLWVDDWTDMLCATLYLPTAIYKYETKKPQTGVNQDSVQWSERHVVGEEWPAENPLGEVTLVEILNNPRLLTGGISELADVTDTQDRLNKTLADRMMTQDQLGFPQKWASGWPDEDDKGVPTKPINVGRDRMVTTDVVEAKFGQWDAAPLDPFSAAKREDAKDISSRTRVPAQYLLGEMNNVNGETLRASESGLVSKCRQRMRGYEDGGEDAAMLARRAAGLPDIPSIEAIWANPEFRTEGELTDSLTKMKTLGVPLQVLWEKWGASPEEVVRWRQLLQQEQDDPVLAKLIQQSIPNAVA